MQATGTFGTTAPTRTFPNQNQPELKNRAANLIVLSKAAGGRAGLRPSNTLPTGRLGV